MNHEINGKINDTPYANLTAEQLVKLMSIEEDINKDRKDKINLIAFENEVK